MPSQRLPLSRKFLIALLSVVLPFYIILSILSHTSQIRPSSAARDPQATDIIELNHTLVPLEAHIMSKCPDARDCLRDLVVPAMEEVVEKVNFTLSFIGSVDNNDSIHYLYPTDPVRYLGFSNCLISSYAKIPSRELVEPCALEHGVDFEDLNSCVSEDGKGLDLLMSSVDRSQSAGVKRSCTVRVNNKTWCVRDGGEWKDCPGGSNPKNLVEEVERLYQE